MFNKSGMVGLGKSTCPVIRLTRSYGTRYSQSCIGNGASMGDGSKVPHRSQATRVYTLSIFE
jgi:hypothetical protein